MAIPLRWTAHSSALGVQSNVTHVVQMVSCDLNLMLNLPSLFASDEMPSNFYNQITSSLTEIPNDLL